MPTARITATRDGSGGWVFAIAGQESHAFAITVTEAVSGATMWAASSGEPGEPVYKATTIVDGPAEPIPLPPSGEMTADWMAHQIRAMGQDPELWSFRDHLRAVSRFEYGIAPVGFQTMPEAQPLPLVPGHAYAVTLTGSFLVPVATGTFIA